MWFLYLSNENGAVQVKHRLLVRGDQARCALLVLTGPARGNAVKGQYKAATTAPGNCNIAMHQGWSRAVLV